MAFGITDEGFVIKPLQTILDEIDEALKAALGDGINLLPQSVFGNLKNTFSERESLLWELSEATYDAQYPNTSQNTSLDNVLSLNGLTRLAATKSIVTSQALFGTATTVVPVGTVFSVDGNPLARFITDANATIGTGTDEVQTITFSGVPTSGAFKLVFDGQTTVAINWDDVAADVQTALRALSNLSDDVTVSGSYAAGFVVTFTGDDGLQPQVAMTATDNTLDDGAPVTITITETTPGVFQATVAMTAESTGPTVANAETLTEIETPVSGLDSTFNVADAVVGRDLESDADARARRSSRIATSLAGPLEAIRNKILTLNDDETKTVLEDVLLFENITEVTDARGIPAKSFESFIFQAGGASDRDQEIAQAIFDSKPAGIRPFGDVSKSVVDTQGFSHTIQFSRPTEVDIWLELDITLVDALGAPAILSAAEEAQMKTDLVTFGNNLGTGQDVIVFPTLVAQVPSQVGINFIRDVVVRIGTAASPTLDDNIIIDDGTVADVELSRWDSARILITEV